MTAWARFLRVGIGAGLPALLLLLAPAKAWDESGQSSPDDRRTAESLRRAAETAEKAGDWDAAFKAYCELYLADRSTPELRDKLNAALRRAQQYRRHRDPQFQHYAATVPVSDAMNLFAEVFTKVPVLYAERERATPQLLWEHGIEELARALDAPAFRNAFLDPRQAERIETFRTGLRFWSRQQIADAKSARLSLRKLIAAAQDSFTVRVPTAVVLEVLSGSCSGLDEYSMFLTPSQLGSESAPVIPDLSMHGIYLSIENGKLLIAGIASGSWAAHHAAQLRKGDQIATLNGQSMAGATLAVVAEALRNPADGLHALELAAMDPDELPFLVHLPAAVPTVYAEGLTQQNRSIGYARIGRFNAGTPRELDDSIHRLKAAGARAMVLDLRGNIGGSFLSSVETARRLLPAGLIVTTQGQVAEVDNIPFSSDSGMTAHDIPLVILVDVETASAAEVLAAALKDNNRATLVGTPTFGKGAIQFPVRLAALDEVDDDGKPRTTKSGGIRLTIAKLIAPRGGAINGVGISPHVTEPNPIRQLELAISKAGELVPTPRPTMPPPELP